MAFRTGENEYYINNERVRLKDITELLTDSGTAKELIYYLKNNNLGRVTFYPLSVINGRYIDNNTINSISNKDGYIGIAADLVSYDNKYSNIISNVLGNIIVIDSIEMANIISSKINRRYKIVILTKM